MKRLLITLLLLMTMSAVAFAQQSATVSGLIQTEAELPENTRVGVHVVDVNGNTLQEISSAAPVAGTFDISAAEAPTEGLEPFRSGAVPLPGLQTEYSVSPEGANFARALTKVYVDNNGNGSFDGIAVDTGFFGVASVESPTGFFVLLYVDQDVTLSGRGAELQLEEGWNIFTVRFPEGGEPVYAVSQNINDAVLDVFVP